MSDVKSLTDEQYQVLKDYAEAVGSEWKRQLSTDWMRAGTKVYEVRERYGLLQQIRNRLGPKWLATFEFDQ
jgi:hypothetical protein